VKDINSQTMPTVVLLCGLPASGKSSLASKLKDQIENLAHIEYDVLEQQLLMGYSDDSEERKREAWNQARLLALEELEKHLGTEEITLILMDDNFHLRGMRKQIHRLLLGYENINFGILWMCTPVEKCIERNQTRPDKVPKEVIFKLHATMELPRVAWEVSWLKVSVDTPTDDIVKFITECPPIIELEEERDPELIEADRLHTLRNQRVIWDQRLRTWVGQVAKFDKKLAKNANAARKEVLVRLKQNDEFIHDDQTLLDSFLNLVVQSEEGNLRRSNLKTQLAALS
jgi:tRNA uridine 5-carbamoylmethylation protein Kti12